MNKAKQLFLVLCILTAILGLAACGKAVDSKDVITANPSVTPTEVTIAPIATVTVAPTNTVEDIETEEIISETLTEEVAYDTEKIEILGTNVSLSIPVNYEYEFFKLSENEYQAKFIPPNVTTDSVIRVYIGITGFEAAEYEEQKEQNNEIMTQEMFQSDLESKYSPDIKIEKFSNSDYLSDLGYAYKIECTFIVDGTNEIMEQLYLLNIDNYNFAVNASDAEKIGLDVIALNIMNSISIK